MFWICSSSSTTDFLTTTTTSSSPSTPLHPPPVCWYRSPERFESSRPPCWAERDGATHLTLSRSLPLLLLHPDSSPYNTGDKEEKLPLGELHYTLALLCGVELLLKSKSRDVFLSLYSACWSVIMRAVADFKLSCTCCTVAETPNWDTKEKNSPELFVINQLFWELFLGFDVALNV